jgi:hypothetical protein
MKLANIPELLFRYAQRDVRAILIRRKLEEYSNRNVKRVYTNTKEQNEERLVEDRERLPNLNSGCGHGNSIRHHQSANGMYLSLLD